MALAFTKRIPGTRTKNAHFVLSGTYTAATDASVGGPVVPGVSAAGAQDTTGISTDGAGNLKAKFGFTPDTVKVKNATTRITLEWFRGMAAGNYNKRLANGTETLETDSGLLVDTSDTSATRGTVTVTSASGGFSDNATVRVEAREAEAVGCKYRIEIEKLENGWTVAVPDYERIEQKEKEAKAYAKKNGSSYSPDYYIGGLTKEYAAKSVTEVMTLVKTAVNRLPSDSEDAAYDAAYDEARTGRK